MRWWVPVSAAALLGLPLLAVLRSIGPPESLDESRLGTAGNQPAGGQRPPAWQPPAIIELGDARLRARRGRPLPGSQAAQPFRVHLAVARPIDPVALEVKRTLEKLRPENPGRALTWRPEDYWHWGVVRYGWVLAVVEIEGKLRDWTANLEVSMYAHNAEGLTIWPLGRHLEVYRLRNGTCALDRESVDPAWDPDKPFGWVTF
jgi:hypothetical protein